MRALLLLLAVLGGETVVGAAVTPEVSSETKSVMRTTQNEMLQHDLWSAYEYAVWAKAQGVELTQAFGDGYVCGNPTFATPNEVVSIKDCGDRVQVVTRARWHCFAPDGHPIISSVALGITPSRVAYGFGTGVLGVLNCEGATPGAWQVRTVGLPAGNVVLEANGFEKEATFNDICSVAVDGTAFTMACYNQITGKAWLVTATAARNDLDNDDLYNPLGTGPNASWILALHREGDWDRPTLVRNGKDNLPLQAGAAGPGIAAIINADGTSQLVTKAGELVPLPLPINIGKNAGMLTVGRWLVVGSGTGAHALDDLDIMGQPMSNPPEQPETLACVLWKDLLANAQNAKFHCFSGSLAPDLDQPAGLFTWRDHALSRLDLSTEVPHLSAFATAAQRITWAWTSHYWTVINEGDGQSSIVNDQGAELWSGEGHPTVQSQETAVIAVGEQNPTMHLVHLAVDPKLRTDVVVETAPNEEILAGPFNDSALVNTNDEAAHWRRIGLDGRKLPLSGSRARSEYPSYVWVSANDGRFYSVSGRTFSKTAAKKPDLDEALFPHDAYSVTSENLLLVITEQGHVLRYTSGAHGLQATDLGTVDHGVRFGIDQHQPVVLDWGRGIRGRFDEGKLVPDDQRPWGEEVPGGPMQISRNTYFVPPGMTQCSWTDQQIGFMPSHLRSCPGDGGMLVVTASLVVWLPPDFLSLFELKNR